MFFCEQKLSIAEKLIIYIYIYRYIICVCLWVGVCVFICSYAFEWVYIYMCIYIYVAGVRVFVFMCLPESGIIPSGQKSFNYEYLNFPGKKLNVTDISAQ